jgi:hypothetical protein
MPGFLRYLFGGHCGEPEFTSSHLLLSSFIICKNKVLVEANGLRHIKLSVNENMEHCIQMFGV